MIARDHLLEVLNRLLKVKLFKDYAPNGLQVAGTSTITRVLTAVSASQRAIEAAVAFKADALLVHHGFFWKSEKPEITGIKRQRLATLLAENINLFAYHLPLDQHSDLGNNVLLGRALGASNIRQSDNEPYIWHGNVAAQSVDAFASLIEKTLSRPAIWVGNPPKAITRIAWCTGSAQDFLTQAIMEGAQVFLSGEYAERTYHEAYELDAVYFSCGHHATETFGIRALGEYLSENHALSVKFFTENNPF